MAKTKRVWLDGEIVTMNVADDPHNDYKPYHKLLALGRGGRVSLALCAYKRPRPINLKADTWMLRWEAVTCPRCLKLKDREDEIRTALREAQEEAIRG